MSGDHPNREGLFIYAWGNNPVRSRWKGRVVRLIAAGARNTVMIEDVETGERMTTSRRALRRVAEEKA